VVEEHRVREAVTDLIHVGLDHIKGYVTPKDLKIYAEQGGLLDKLELMRFDDIESYQKKERSIVFDVRKTSEYEEFHVPDALHIAYTRLADRIDEVPADKKLLVHCQSGSRSAVASAYLKRHGYDVVLIEDDINNYRQKQAATI
jgi:hydroxyacylglutathione hydrolase